MLIGLRTTMTSKNTFRHRFTQIDDLTRPDHIYLSEWDNCYFLGEYTAYKDYSFSETNNLIFNFKKSLELKGEQQWKYKKKAIENIANAFRKALHPEELDSLTFVPVPPSKAKTHHLYDNRLTKLLHAIHPDRNLDIREFIMQSESTNAFHQSEKPRNPQQIEQLYKFQEFQNMSNPEKIAIIDDVLTTGAHYIAVKNILSRQFPEASIFGLFIARRVPGTSDI